MALAGELLELAKGAEREHRSGDPESLSAIDLLAEGSPKALEIRALGQEIADGGGDGYGTALSRSGELIQGCIAESADLIRKRRFSEAYGPLEQLVGLLGNLIEVVPRITHLNEALEQLHSADAHLQSDDPGDASKSLTAAIQAIDDLDGEIWDARFWREWLGDAIQLIADDECEGIWQIEDVMRDVSEALDAQRGELTSLDTTRSY